MKEGEVYMNSPTVSVLMAVYNGEKHLREAMDSILNQTFSDYEFIIVDDCSADKTPVILEKYAQKDQRIVLIHNERNLGLTVSLNRGLARVKGKYIARMDADDISLPERLTMQIHYMEEHPDCAVVGTQAVFIDDDGDVLRQSNNPLEHKEIEDRLWRGEGLVLIHASAVMRHEAVVKAGGYHKEAGFAEDLDLYLRLAEMRRLANLPDVLFNVRLTPDSITGLGSEDDDTALYASVVREALIRRGMNPADVEIGHFPRMKSRAEWHAEQAWRLYKKDGDMKVARKHAFRALRYNPFYFYAWRAFIYVVLGKKTGESIRKIVVNKAYFD